MKRTLIIVAAALIGLGLTGATAATVGEVKKDGAERAYEKVKKEVKKDYKAARDGTVKTVRKAGKGSEKAYDKTKEGTEKVVRKVAAKSKTTYKKAEKGTVKVAKKVGKGTESISPLFSPVRF